MKRTLWILLALAVLICVSATGALADFILPPSTEVIEAEAFMDNGSIERVVLNEGLKRIESRAFSGCPLKTLTLPSTLEFIADDAFDWDPNLSVSVHAPKGSYAWKWAVDHGYLFPWDVEASWLDCYTVTWEPIAGVDTYKVYWLTQEQYQNNDQPNVYTFGSEGTGYINTDVGVQYLFFIEYSFNGIGFNWGPVSPDPIPPLLAPENLAWTPQDGDTILLTWDPVPGATGYRVYWSEYPDWDLNTNYYSTWDGTETVDPAAPSMVVSVNDWDDFYIWVCADNGDGPNLRAGTHVCTTDHPRPKGVYVWAANTDFYYISWSLNEDAVGCRVYWSQNDTVTKESAYQEFGPEDTYTLFVMYPGERRYFALSALYGDGESELTGVYTDTPLEPMPAPQNARVESVEDGIVRLAWDAVPGAENYRIFFSDSPEYDQNNWHIYTDSDQNFFDFDLDQNGLEPDSAYFWITVQTDLGPGYPSERISVNEGGNAETEGTWGSLNWSLDADGVLTVSGEGAMDDFNYGPVDAWHAYRSDIRSVVISSGITRIGNYAFQGCDQLSHADMADTVTSWGDCVFEGCGSLTDIVIPDSVHTMGIAPFYNCGNLSSVTLPEGIAAVPYEGFLGCGSLSRIVIPDGVTVIETRAFCYCGSLADATLPISVTTIGEGAFEGCSSLADVYYTGSEVQWNAVVVEDGNRALAGASMHFETSGAVAASGICGENLTWTLDEEGTLTVSGTGEMWNFSLENDHTTASWWTAPVRVVLEEGVESVGSYAFYCCETLTSISIPNSLIHIGSHAFYNCSGFTGSLTIPDSVTSIGNYAFYVCSGFTGNLTIPDSVTSIGDYAFYRCSRFTGNLIIPNSVTSIASWAFGYCSGFTGNLTIPDSVTSIGNYAFYGCSGFTGNLSIPNSVTSIGDSAFYGCSGFTGTLTIPDSVMGIGESAFQGCSGFTGNLTIPDSVTSIGNSAFFGCSGFTGNLMIPNSVTSIASWAFGYCSGFTGTLTIPNSVTSIGDCAFYGCSGFTGNLTIPDSVTSIGREAFGYCSGFTGNLTIPDSVTSIGDYAFKYCSNLKKISVEVTDSDGTVSTVERTAVYCPRDSYAWTWAEGQSDFEPVEWDGVIEREIVYSNLTGHLLTEAGEPIADACVYIYHDYELVDMIYSNGDGTWTTSNVEVGKTYSVMPTSQMYVFSSLEVRVTREQQEVSGMIGQMLEQYLITNTSNIKFGPEAATYDLIIYSNLNWTVDTEATWIHLSADAGSGNAVVTVMIDENQTDSVRVDSLQLQADDRSCELPVAQTGTSVIRLNDPVITVPAGDGQQLEYGAITVEWTGVPGADHYVVSLRDLDTDNLIICHSVRAESADLRSTLTPEYFDYGVSYRLAVGAVPKGFESSDTLTGWSERLFSISELPVSEETWIYGRVMEYNDEDVPIPVEGATLELYSLNESGESTDDTARYVASVLSEDDGTWVFHDLTPGTEYAVLVTARPVSSQRANTMFKSSSSSSRGGSSNLFAKSYTGAIRPGGNMIDDLIINGDPVGDNSTNGLWARFYNYSDKNSFDDESLRYIRTVDVIDYTFMADTDEYGNKIIRYHAYDGSGSDKNLAHYLSLNNFGIIFTGRIRIPEAQGETQIRLRGDDGISLRIGTTVSQDWHTKGIIENSKTITIDASIENEYPLEVKYFNQSGAANLVLEYRFKIGSKWQQWHVVPVEWFFLGATPTINPTLSFWDTRETIKKLNKSLDNYVDAKLSDYIVCFAQDKVMSGITEYSQAFDGASYSLGQSRTSFINGFGVIAKTGLGKKALDKIGEVLGVAVGTLSGTEKAAEIKKAVLNFCHLEEDDPAGLQLNIDAQFGIESVVNILTFVEDKAQNGASDAKALLKTLDSILMYDLDPITGEVYDHTDPQGEAITLSDIVSTFFKTYKFAEQFCDMLTNAVDGAKSFNDSDRMKSFLFLCTWNDYHGVKETEVLNFVETVKTANNASITNYITDVSGSKVGKYEHIRRLDNLDLIMVFENEIKKTFGNSYMEAIYKQLLLDCMDSYMSEVYKVPDDVKWVEDGVVISDLILPQKSTGDGSLC